MKKEDSLLRCSETVDGYTVPVLNEREIRAAAGILFLVMFLALMFILFNGDFVLIKYVVTTFLADLVIRVSINPAFSPALILARLIVGRQSPEYVAAKQKIFAWKIGIAVASLMFFLLVVINSYSIITALGCFVCLVFLFFESAFGICLGCLVYSLCYKKEMQYCAGDSCATPAKQAIQKTSFKQLFVLLGFAVFVLLLVVFVNRQFSAAPKNLGGIVSLTFN